MTNHLSLVSKLDGVQSFIVPLSTCKDRCEYYDVRKEVRKLSKRKIKAVCYWKNNPNRHYKAPKNMYKRNLRLMRAANFVKVLSNEILRANCRKFRFFSGGQTETVEQLKNILRICKICHMVKFAIMINSDIQISQLIQSRFKVPKNTNLLLSNYQQNKRTPEFMIKANLPYNIGNTQTTLNKNLATCEASKVKNGKCGTCEKCYYEKDITFFIHGKYNKKRVLKND